MDTENHEDEEWNEDDQQWYKRRDSDYDAGSRIPTPPKPIPPELSRELEPEKEEKEIGIAAITGQKL